MVYYNVNIRILRSGSNIRVIPETMLCGILTWFWGALVGPAVDQERIGPY